jgi:tetratricopeptide (TPR) repeat protein
VTAEGQRKRTQRKRESFSWREGPFLILPTLADGERDTLGITKGVEQRIGNEVFVDPADVYRIIPFMAELGLIEESGERPERESGQTGRRYYRIAGLGRRLMAAEVEQAAALVEKSKRQPGQEKLQPALDIDPKYGDACNDLYVACDSVHYCHRMEHELAELWMHVGKHDEAESLQRRALERDPDAPRLLLNLGIALNYLGRYADSLEPLSKVLRLRPYWFSSHIFLGIAFLEIGQLADAQTHLERGTQARSTAKAIRNDKRPSQKVEQGRRFGTGSRLVRRNPGQGSQPSHQKRLAANRVKRHDSVKMTIELLQMLVEPLRPAGIRADSAPISLPCFPDSSPM